MIEIREVGSDRLQEYARIPIAFEVRTIYRVEPLDPGFRLVEEEVSEPYVKDYDTSDDPDGRVPSWTKRFDVSKWGFFIAAEGVHDVGAATMAIRTPGVHMLEDRSDLGVLWDIRVRPEWRRHGVGAALFQHAAGWALARGCRQMKIETQNTNVPACQFYARQGCVLGGINRFAYAGCPAVTDEIMLLWYLGLSSAGANTRSRTG